VTQHRLIRLIFVSLIGVLPTAAAQSVCETYQESPDLAAQVEAGELPPISERLPKEPVVVEPAEEIGTYGGALNDLYDGYRLAEFRQYGYENLVRWNVEGTEVIPNIAKSWEISEDATAYTFFLREGLKWSDGTPFTADDILFWWEEVETDPEISPDGAQEYFYVDGELAEVTKVDDYTVRFSWSQPHGLLLQNLSTSYGVRVTQFSRHYLEQFDPDYNPEGVKTMMAAAGESDFGTWWHARVGSYGSTAEYNDPNRPLMQPWIPTDSYVGKERFALVRNPYYFKVDPACNQLPYIDERVFTLATDPEVRLLKTLDGEDMFSDRDISLPPNKAVFFDHQEAGNYRFIDVINSDFNTMQLHLKFNHPDQVRAEVFQNKDFRIGLSHAMDRQTVIDTVYVGQGIPYQQAPRPESPFYNERLATQYTEFNPELANEHLDRVMPERDAEGFRLRPDGQRFTFTVVINQEFRPDWVDVMQLVARNWREVGIDVRLDVVSNDTQTARYDQPATDASVWAGENGTGQLPLLAAGAFTPERASGWIAWEARQLNPDADVTAEPVAPPPALQRQYEILTELKKTFDPDAQAKLMDEMLELSADQFLTIGLSLPAGDYRVVHNSLRNVPEPLIAGWLYPGPAPANFETFYIDTGAAASAQ